MEKYNKLYSDHEKLDDNMKELSNENRMLEKKNKEVTL